jgi:hypothetical protein
MASRIDIFNKAVDAFQPVNLCNTVATKWQPGSLGLLRDAEAFSSLLGTNWQNNMRSTAKSRTLDASTLYTLSFLLRHAATWVAVSARQAHTPTASSALGSLASSPYAKEHSTLQLIWNQKFQSQLDIEAHGTHKVIVNFALSARGIEWRISDTETCSYFDPYAIHQCHERSERPGGMCITHTPHDWITAPGSFGLRHVDTTRQASLFAYYSNISNLNAYSNDELEEMIQSFLKKLGRAGALSHLQPTGTLDHAATQLGYSSASEAKAAGIEDLKARFRSKARLIHPDCGGSAPEFQGIESAYRSLLVAFAP